MTALPIPICPITQLPINNPMIDSEGNTYEEYAIIQWLSIKQISPITKNPLKITDLVRNRAMADIIEIIKNLEINNKDKDKDTSQIISETNSNKNNIIKACSDCGKNIKVSASYKGKQLPKCFNCRAWNCKACTFKNNCNLIKCEICDTPK